MPGYSRNGFEHPTYIPDTPGISPDTPAIFLDTPAGFQIYSKNSFNSNKAVKYLKT
jgi:hypothetical protein